MRVSLEPGHEEVEGLTGPAWGGLSSWLLFLGKETPWLSTYHVLGASPVGTVLSPQFEMRPGSRDVKVLGAEQARAGMRGAEGTAVSRQWSITVWDRERLREGNKVKLLLEALGVCRGCSLLSRGACKLSPVPPPASEKEREPGLTPRCFCILRNAAARGSSDLSQRVRRPGPVEVPALLCVGRSDSGSPQEEPGRWGRTGSNIYAASCRPGMLWSSLSLSVLLYTVGVLSLSGLPKPCRGDGIPVSGLGDRETVAGCWRAGSPVRERGGGGGPASSWLWLRPQRDAPGAGNRLQV